MQFPTSEANNAFYSVHPRLSECPLLFYLSLAGNHSITLQHYQPGVWSSAMCQGSSGGEGVGHDKCTADWPASPRHFPTLRWGATHKG